MLGASGAASSSSCRSQRTTRTCMARLSGIFRCRNASNPDTDITAGTSLLMVGLLLTAETQRAKPDISEVDCAVMTSSLSWAYEPGSYISPAASRPLDNRCGARALHGDRIFHPS